MKLAAFYHAYLVGSWRHIFAEQLSKVQNSGLLESLDSFQCGIIGQPEARTEFASYVKPLPKFHIAHSSHHNQFEYPTLQKLYRYCRDNQDAYVLYFHTKSVTKDLVTHPGSHSWRRYLEWGNIERWRDCVKLLQEGYETVGLKCHADQAPFYAGNFWWATASYVCTLTDPVPVPDRFLAESWIGRGLGWPRTWHHYGQHRIAYLHTPKRDLDFQNEIYERREYVNDLPPQ